MAENKTVPTDASVAEFIAAVEQEQRRNDAEALLEIYGEITGFPAVLWGTSIVGFGTHHYRYESGREGDVPAAGFSPRKANLTIYVGNEFEGADELFSQLGKHKKSTACLYISKLVDVDESVLKEIIQRDFQRSLETSM